MSVTPIDASARVCAGVDWAKDDHAVCIVDVDGDVIDRFTVAHTAAGLRRLIHRLLKAGVVEVGIERGDGPVVQALLAAGLVVLVIAPNQLKNLRSSVRARRDLVQHRVAAANQLRAHLHIVLPGVVGLFAALDSPVSLAFLERFTTQAKIDWLTPARLSAWLTKIDYSGKVAPDVLHQRLLAAPRGTTDINAQAHAATTLAFVAVLRSLNTQISVLADSIAAQLQDHPDAHIVTSLPRAGTLRAARLLAEIGDARGRFPTPDPLACLAGIAPSTRQSGKVKTVTFRWSADSQLRDALCDFAADSRHDNPWAADLYWRARNRGHNHPHAVRILARAWANTIWRCWQDSIAYNPARHNALQRHLNEHTTQAA